MNGSTISHDLTGSPQAAALVCLDVGVTDDLWTSGDVAEYLRVPQRTVRTWWRRGIIPGGTKLPGTSVVRFYPAEVMAWAESGRQGTKAVT